MADIVEVIKSHKDFIIEYFDKLEKAKENFDTKEVEKALEVLEVNSKKIEMFLNMSENSEENAEIHKDYNAFLIECQKAMEDGRIWLEMQKENLKTAYGSDFFKGIVYLPEELILMTQKELSSVVNDLDKANLILYNQAIGFLNAIENSLIDITDKNSLEQALKNFDIWFNHIKFYKQEYDNSIDLQRFENLRESISKKLQDLQNNRENYMFKNFAYDTQNISNSQNNTKNAFEERLTFALKDNAFWLEQIKLTLLITQELSFSFEKLEKHYNEDLNEHLKIKEESKEFINEAKNEFFNVKNQVLDIQDEFLTFKAFLESSKQDLESLSFDNQRFYEELRAKLETLCEDTNAKSAEVLLFRQKILEAIERLDEVIESSKTLQGTLEKAEGLNDKLNSLNENLTNDFKALNQSLTNDFKALNENLVSDYEKKFKENAQNANLEFLSRSNEFLEKINKLDNKILSYLPDDEDEQEALKQAKLALETCENEFLALKNQNELLQKQQEELNAQIKALESELKKSSLELLNLQNEIAELNKEITLKELRNEDKSELELSKEQKNSQLQSLQGQIDDLKASLELLNNDLEQKNQQKAQNDEEIKQKDLNKLALLKECENAENDLKNALYPKEDAHGATKKYVDMKMSEFKDFEQKLMLSFNVKEPNADKIKNLEEELRALEYELKSLQSSKFDINEKLKTLFEDEKIAENLLISKKQACYEKITLLEKSIASLDTEKQNLEKEIPLLENELSELELNISNLNNQHSLSEDEKLTEQLNLELASKLSQKTLIEAELSQKKERLNEIIKLLDEYVNLNLPNEKKKLSLFLEKIEIIKSEINLKNEELSNKQAQIELLNSLKASLNTSKEELENEKAILQGKNEDTSFLNDRIEDFKKRIQEKDDKLLTLQTQIQTLKSEILSLETSLKEKSMLESLKALITQKESEYKENQNLILSLNSSIQTLKSELENLEKELSFLKEQITNGASEKQEELEQKEQVKRTKELELIEKQTKLSFANELKQSLRKIVIEKRQLRNSLDDFNTLITNKEEELKKLEEALKQRLSNIESKKNELENKKSEIEAKNEEFSLKDDNLEDTLSTEKELLELGEALEILRAELKELEFQKSQSKDELLKAKEHLTKLLNSKEDIEIIARKEDLEAKNADLEKAFKENSLSLEAKNKLLSEVKLKIKQIELQLKNIDEKLADEPDNKEYLEKEKELLNQALSNKENERIKYEGDISSLENKKRELSESLEDKKADFERELLRFNIVYLKKELEINALKQNQILEQKAYKERLISYAYLPLEKTREPKANDIMQIMDLLVFDEDLNELNEPILQEKAKEALTRLKVLIWGGGRS